MKRNKTVLLGLILLAAAAQLSGCWAAAAGAGAEAGYVASQEKRSAAETIGDQVIVSKVKTKLLADSRVSGFDINVDSYKGVVTLRGALREPEEIAVATSLAKETSGVKQVVSKLVLVD